MIAAHRTDDERFERALGLIEGSGVVDELEALNVARRGVGGRPPRGITYTMKGVLVALTLLIDRCTTPSMKRVLEELVFRLDDEQLARLGMSIRASQRDAVKKREPWGREYRRFMAWLARQVAVIDSEADQPARRITNAEDKRIRDARTSEDEEAAIEASEHGRRICNLLVAASVRDPHPDGYRGDIVVDESTFDVCKTSEDVGARATAKRSAVSIAGFYRRSEGVLVEPGTGKTSRVEKMGFGVGMTAVMRVGEPTALRRVVPVITAIDIHRPTAASLEGLRNALDCHAENGFDPRTRTSRPQRNARWPYLTVDMGYNPLRGFAELLIERRYSMIAGYPAHWSLVSQTEHPEPTERTQEPGPIVGHGDVYCPAAARLLRTGPLVTRVRDMKQNGVAEHDARLRQLLPMLMGTNSRIKTGAARPGRPRRGEPTPVRHRLDVVCPAVQGRVRCPLKPESLHASPAALPTVAPEWDATTYRCCEKSQTTIVFTEPQVKRYQGSFTPGSWEHLFHLEAYRAMTERQFQLVKSVHTTGLDKINYGPRREPLLKLILAIAVAVSNLEVQDAPVIRDVDSVAERFENLARHLGRKPAKTPPRT
ncbi:hypothetical protein ABTZ46_17895 [Nocardioides sp. NPDC126508]